MISWPATLPQYPERPGFQSGTGDGRLRSQTDSGIAKLRRRFSAVPRPLQLQMTMTYEQLAIFRSFVENDLKGGTLPFLFASKSRTNLFSWSEEFDNAFWVKPGTTIVADAALAPDGTMTMDKLVDSTSNSAHGCVRSFSYLLGERYTLSVYAKAGEYSKLRINAPFDSGLGLANFDLAAKTASVLNGAGAIARIEDVGAGALRCSLTITATNTNTQNVGFYLINNAGNISFAGDGASGLHIWGAQLEAGDRATDYIRTEAAPVTVRTGPDGDDTWIVQFGQNMPTWVPSKNRWLVSLDLVVLP